MKMFLVCVCVCSLLDVQDRRNNSGEACSACHDVGSGWIAEEDVTPGRNC